MLYTQYGPPEVIQPKEVEKPIPRDNEVLIRVHATTVTPGDCKVRSFKNIPAVFWLPFRVTVGLRTPKDPFLGCELAGEIEAVGNNVTLFKKGDQVFAATTFGPGTSTQYVCLPQDGPVAVKPANTTYAEAAAVPFGALSALTFLRGMAHIQSGQRVCINGASGSVGTFAVQLAKYFGADVTGVCSAANIDMVKSLGADTVIDYGKEDFTTNGETYDIIFDAVGKSSFSRCKSALTQHGVYLQTLPTLTILIQMLWTSIIGGKKAIFGINEEKAEDLTFLKELVEAGTIRPVIDRRYPLKQLADAHSYVETGHKKGNVVITVEHNNTA